MNRVVTLVAKPLGTIRLPEGYRLVHEDCYRCGRDFVVSLPTEGYRLVGLVLEIPCPYCPSARVEVLIEPSDRPIYIEPIQRSWAGWQSRRAARGLFWFRARIFGSVSRLRWSLWRLSRRILGEQKAAPPGSGHNGS